MTDLLTIGARLMHKQAQRSELEKTRAAEAERLAAKRLRQTWELLIGEHAQAIREACDTATLDYAACGKDFKECVVRLTRGRKKARIEIDCGTPGGPHWRPDGWKSWQRPNPDEVTLYIWSALFDEHEQRTALHELDDSVNY